MYLTISDILDSDRNDRDGEGVDVWCRAHGSNGARLYVVRVTARSVTVYGVHGDDIDSDGIDFGGDIGVAHILVATDLINATRRLFGLVGVA